MYNNLAHIFSQQQVQLASMIQASSGMVFPPMMVPGLPYGLPCPAPQMIPAIMAQPGLHPFGPPTMAPNTIFAQQMAPTHMAIFPLSPAPPGFLQPVPVQPDSAPQKPAMAMSSAPSTSNSSSSSASVSSSTRTSRSSSFSSTSGENGKISKGSNEEKENFKTRLCIHFTRSGRCPKGSECGFAHGEEELLTMLSSAPFPALVAQKQSTVLSSNSAPSTSQDNETPRKFKTILCRHFTNTGRCPKRDSCGFAHGAHELQASQRTLEKKALNSKHKTRLCDNFAKGGSQDCPYGFRCEFVHPSDKEYFLEFYGETEEFHQKAQEWKNKVQEQHMRKTKTMPLHEEHSIDQRILRMVKAWNKGHPKGPHYYDLHGLTVQMAEKYVKDIIEDLVATGIEKAKIETGRGNHSSNGFAAIRASILTKFQGFKGAQFVPEEFNDGILVLTFSKST